MKTRSKFDSGSGDGFGALRFLFRALRDPPAFINETTNPY